MSTIGSWNDLKEYGIIPLTGESCGIGMRMLCDVNEKGVEILKEFFGDTIEFQKKAGWNDREGCSIMLPFGIIAELGAFILLRNHDIVMTVGGTSTGYSESSWEKYGEDLCAVYRNSGRNFRTYRKRGTAGTRNVHVMSGRVS